MLLPQAPQTFGEQFRRPMTRAALAARQAAAAVAAGTDTGACCAELVTLKRVIYSSNLSLHPEHAKDKAKNSA